MKSTTVIALIALFASSDQSFGVNALSVKQKESTLNLIDAETENKGPKKKSAAKKGKKSKKSSKKKEEASEEDKKKKQDEKE
jgi:hypothetical protein